MRSAKQALDLANRQVAQGKQRIARQERVIDALRRDGLPTDLAHDTLDAVHTTQQSVVADRKAIKATLEQSRPESSPRKKERRSASNRSRSGG